MCNKVAEIQKLFQRIKLLSPFNLSLLQINSKIRLNASLLRLNLLSDLAKGALAPSPWLRHRLQPQIFECALKIKTAGL